MRRSYPYKPADCLVCPSCGSFERHRFAYLALKDRLADYAEKVLHIAPERCLEPWLRSISGEYLSVDLSSGSAMEHMDITDLKLQDDRFSLVWCSHVLEHIENDRKAISELFRVLRPSGLAVILVPTYGNKTYENHNIQSPEERLKHFKQEDHVRLYGSDIENRLVDVDFKVDVLRVSDIPAKIVAKHALEYPSTKELFLCSKPCRD
jgi:SAM-dependent methyltransferase